jgi:hypothetical protein
MSISINFPYRRNTRPAKPRPLFRTTDADTIKIEQRLRCSQTRHNEKLPNYNRRIEKIPDGLLLKYG